MMRKIWTTAATGVFAILFGNAANAADVRQLPGAPPLLESAPLLVDEFGSNWYLRGDIGYRINQVDRVTNADPPPGVRGHELDNSWVFGLGVGYKWEWLRSDLTLDYGSESGFTADSRRRQNVFSAKVDSVTGLLNVYGDFGTWYGLTPYIGAGIGLASLHATQFHVRSRNHGGRSGSDINTNFAWAYMAGLSYRVSENYSIDLGYRHVNMGDAITGIDANDSQLRFKKMSADEIRLGFRYLLD
jgi:opacity protein-like surface antigen